jgi:alkanesulfonate monooxygenase SsuD/methylene tetrahydromethanopterin reductase-like flavin-dependent oxidoreductase (luciferase family)
MLMDGEPIETPALEAPEDPPPPWSASMAPTPAAAATAARMIHFLLMCGPPPGDALVIDTEGASSATGRSVSAAPECASSSSPLSESCFGAVAGRTEAEAKDARG